MTLRPVCLVAAVAAVSCGLLTVAIVLGWLGPDVGRGANFCEAARDGLLKQPANTLSNLGFVVAGLAIAALAERLPTGGGGVLTRPVATAYAVVVTLLGPASAAMHATQSAWGGHLDMLSMYLVSSFAAAWALARLVRRPGLLWVLLPVFVIGCELVGLVSSEVPVVHFAGNLAFAVLLLVALAGELVLSRRPDVDLPLGWGIAAVVAMLVAFVIWVASQHGLCDPHSLLQGHAVWHLLNALAAYGLARHWAGERPATPSLA